jgi:hypothetical protein
MCMIEREMKRRTRGFGGATQKIDSTDTRKTKLQKTQPQTQGLALAASLAAFFSLFRRLRSRLASLSSSTGALSFFFFFFSSAPSSGATSDTRFRFFSLLSDASPCEDSSNDVVAVTGSGADPEAGTMVEGPAPLDGGTYAERLVYPERHDKLHLTSSRV